MYKNGTCHRLLDALCDLPLTLVEEVTTTSDDEESGQEEQYTIISLY